MSSSQVGALDSAGAASVAPPVSSPATSSGVDGGTGESTGALLTDDQILGIAGDEGVASSTAEVTPAAGTKTAEATPSELSIDDFKSLFASTPKLNSLWDRYDNNQKLVSQFGTVADARKAAEIVQMHGGIAPLEQIATRASKLDQVDSVFFGGKPEERKSLANEWYDGQGPHELPVTQKAVYDQVEATLGVMQERDPQGYVNVLDKVTREALGRENFDAYLGNIAKALQSGQGLDEAVKQLLGWGARLGLDKGKSRQPNPEAEQLAKRAKELDQRDQTWNQSQQDAVVNAADAEYGTSIKSEISKTLGDFRVNGRPVFGPNVNPMVKQTMESQIWEALNANLMKNPVYIAQGNSIKAKGLIGKQKDLVDLTMRHARLALPGVIESVVGSWTKSVVAGAKDTTDRAKNGASRVDLGGGSTAGGKTKPTLTLEEVKKKGMTPDQILDF